MTRGSIVALAHDTEGAAVVEFALIAPVLMVVLMGLFDLAYNMYTAEMLQGAIQHAARDSTVEGAASNQTTIDGNVTRAVHAISPQATLRFNRKSYTSFTGVNRPEDYTDVNANGTCDNGEPYEDANGNGNWDLDPGTAGFGAARDAVLYSVTVDYRRAFPIFALIPGQTENFTLVANTVLRNQPYAEQANTTPAKENCE